MNEERNKPQSTAELAYGRTDNDSPVRPPDDEVTDGRPLESTGSERDRTTGSTDLAGPESGRTTTQDSMATTPVSGGDAGADGRPTQDVDRSIEQAPLLDTGRTARYSEQWHSVQAKFVEEPKDAVREADGLVAEVIQALATSFAEQRQQLEGKWDSGTDVSTEDLRQALIQYRSFFQRLLAA